jgi:hypothetical protein
MRDTEAQSTVAAYSSTMRMMLIPGIVIAIIPLVAAFFVKGACRCLSCHLRFRLTAYTDFRLLEIQNAVEVKTLDGKRAENAGESIAPKILEEKV